MEFGEINEHNIRLPQTKPTSHKPLIQTVPGESTEVPSDQSVSDVGENSNIDT